MRGRHSVTHKLRLGCLLLVSADQMINVQVIETVWAVRKDAGGRCCLYLGLLQSLLYCLQRKYGHFQIEFATGPHPSKRADGSNGSTCHALSSLRRANCNEGVFLPVLRSVEVSVGQCVLVLLKLVMLLVVLGGSDV